MVTNSLKLWSAWKGNRLIRYQKNTNNTQKSIHKIWVMFYDDKIIIPKNRRNTVITLLRKGHPSINKMTHAAKLFWWPKKSKDIQQKCDKRVLFKMTGKSIKPQLPMSETNYLSRADKTNQEIQLDFIGPITNKQRRFFILVLINRYSRWPAACICETPTRKTAKSFLEQYVTL